VTCRFGHDRRNSIAVDLLNLDWLYAGALRLFPTFAITASIRAVALPSPCNEAGSCVIPPIGTISGCWIHAEVTIPRPCTRARLSWASSTPERTACRLDGESFRAIRILRSIVLSSPIRMGVNDDRRVVSNCLRGPRIASRPRG
jgi:hypothetical protein